MEFWTINLARLLGISIEGMIRRQKRVTRTDNPRNRKGGVNHKSTILSRSACRLVSTKAFLQNKLPTTVPWLAAGRT